MISFELLTPFWVSLRLACVTTLVLLIIALPLACWLIKTPKSFLKFIVETAVALPLVLPPTVLGFYLLIILNEQGFLGHYWTLLTGSSLVFTFTGLVIGSTLYSLPFSVQPLQTAFESIGSVPEEVAITLGASKLDYFFSVHLFLAKRGLLTATVLAFAHTLGEFGVVLMIGGNIPGTTRVASIAIYDLVEELEYSNAHFLSAAMLIFSFAILFLLFTVNKTRQVKL